MIALITHSQLVKKLITENITAAKFATFLDEAQELDLRPLMGEELYIDLLDDAVNSPAFGVYADLMNGSTYTKNDRRYKHEGIVTVLSYYTYSRYLMESGAHSTPYGMVQKTNDFSTPSTDKTIARKISQAQSAGKSYWERVQRYIIHNQTPTFLNLYTYGAGTNRTQQGIKISAIGGNSNDKYRYKT